MDVRQARWTVGRRVQRLERRVERVGGLSLLMASVCENRDETKDLADVDLHRLMAYDFLCSYALREADVVSL